MTIPTTRLTVEIDVGNEEHLVAEAAAAGCTATSTPEGYRPSGTYVYRVTGPAETLLPLLASWGYPDEGDYRVLPTVARRRRRIVLDVPVNGVPATDINAMVAKDEK